MDGDLSLTVLEAKSELKILWLHSPTATFLSNISGKKQSQEHALRLTAKLFFKSDKEVCTLVSPIKLRRREAASKFRMSSA